MLVKYRLFISIVKPFETKFLRWLFVALSSELDKAFVLFLKVLLYWAIYSLHQSLQLVHNDREQ